MTSFQPRGVIANVFTISHDDGSLDDNGQRRFLDALVETESVSAYFVRSGMGQMYAFVEDDVKQIAKTACDHLDGVAPVLVGASGVWDRNRDQRPDVNAFTEQSIALSQYAQDAGAAGVVHTLPEAVIPPNGDYAGFTIEYFEQVAASVDIPVLIYQPPGTDPNYCVTPDTLARIAAINGMSAIKVSTGDAGYIFDLTHAVRGTAFAFITGNESAWLWGLHCGSQAVIGQGACLNPQILKAVQERFEREDLPGAADAQADINKLVAACPNAVDFLKRYLNERGFTMSAAFRPKRDNPYAEADRIPMTDDEYETFKTLYESVIANY